MRSRPVDPHELSAAKIWNKTERHELSHEDKAHFVKAATSYAVLSKHNKLDIYSLKENEDGSLHNVRNTQLQLRQLQTHTYNFDIGDVCVIVQPYDVLKTSAIGKTRFNLFQDFAKLDAAMVATSNAWYNTWVDAPYIQENMTYLLQLLQNNTSESLWNKCLEEYEAYHAVYQGGPLMLFLILKRIQSNSENAIQHLKDRIKNLKIRDLKGEDVDLAVSLIRSTHKALSQASADDRNYVPDDFPQTVLQVLQTSSVKKFNDAFSLEEQQCQHEADKYGGRPEWPTLEHILNLATNTYHRLHKSDQWNIPKKKGYTVTTDRVTLICWNCGGPHHLKDCPKPKDKKRIEENKKKFMASRRPSGSGTYKKKNKPRGPDRRGDIRGDAHAASTDRKTKNDENGNPLVLNAKNQWVPDQKALQAQRKKEQEAQRNALQAAVQEAAEATEEHPEVRAQIARVQDVIKGMF